jgi:hypothetical protein
MSRRRKLLAERPEPLSSDEQAKVATLVGPAPEAH